MATNLIERGNGRQRVVELVHPFAAERDSFMELDVANRRLHIGAIGDEISCQSDLPVGSILGTPSQVQIVGDVTGWEYPVTGSPLLKKIQWVDLQSSKIQEAVLVGCNN